MTRCGVCLVLPCAPTYARVARAAAAACGALEGFSVDDLSDLRLLVDEVFSAMHGLGVQRVEMELEPAGGAVVVRMRAEGSLGSCSPGVDVGVTQRLARVVAHDVDLGLSGERPTFEATLARW